MNISAINSVSNKNNYSQVNFTKREVDEKGNNPYMSKSKGPLVAIPLATLIALTTANYSPANAKTLGNEPTQTEFVAPQPQRANVHTIPADVDPHDIVTLKDEKIQEVTPFLVNGKKYNLIYTTIKDKTLGDRVYDVYIAPSDFDGYVKYKNTKRVQDPPKVLNLIYHDLGDDSKSFCAVSIKTTVQSDDYSKHTDYCREMKVPDEIGQKIMDLISNYSKWENHTNIGFFDSDNPKLYAPSVKIEDNF